MISLITKADEPRAFRVPEGFVVEKVVGPPLVDRPIVADFDDLGRLYVADSSGSNDPVKQQLVDRPHRIVRLEDSDGDGTFDRSVVFADRMMFPAGAMWRDGSLYVASPPSIWKLTDLDGDGRADRREEWFAGKTLTGCANDLHGPFAGPDGRIYWTKGAFAPQTYPRLGREPFSTRAAHIFRSRLDGSEIEPVMTGGMDNPVEVAFTPEGERIFTTTFLQHPGGGRRDGLIHALYGGVYGKVHDVLGGHPRTGPGVLPTLDHLGPAAPSGLSRAESDALGSRDALFTACFNLRKVTRHRLSPDGGSFASQTDDFLRSDDLDFHPTDVLEDADGSLLVIDTGGWYKLCCPTSQLVKPDVLGAIYRVRRREVAPVDDPRGLKLAWASMAPEALAKLLDDPRPVVRRRAVASLASNGEAAVPAIARALTEGSTESRRNAAWAACRIDGPVARRATRSAIGLGDASIRQVAIHSAGLWRDRLAGPELAASLRDPSAAVRRSAAEALGRLGDPKAVPGLLGASASEGDWAVRHSLTYALIEIAEPSSTRQGLSDPSPPARSTALIALDQMGARLEGAEVLRLLDQSTDAESRRTLLWVMDRHPEWGAPTAFLESWLGSSNLSGESIEELEGQLARFARTPTVQDLLARWAADDSPPELRRLALRSMARSSLKVLPESWLMPLEFSMRHGDQATVRQALATLRAFPWPRAFRAGLANKVLEIAQDSRRPADLRLAALSSMASPRGPVDSGVFDFLLDQLIGDRPAASRTSAADFLAKARLGPSQLDRLSVLVGSAGPLELPRLLDAFDHAEGEEIGRKLVEGLRRSPARSTLRAETLRPRLARFGSVTTEAAETLYREIEADSADRVSRLETLLGQVGGGDVRRGQVVFNGSKAACVTCHAIGYVGGRLGPDLSKIGQVRAERDLLEAIAYPSASFVRSYEPTTVSTRDGRSFSGILKQEGADEIVLAVSADREERIPRSNIEEVGPGKVSVMPEGLDRVLSRTELADLIAFLKACR